MTQKPLASPVPTPTPTPVIPAVKAPAPVAPAVSTPTPSKRVAEQQAQQAAIIQSSQQKISLIQKPEQLGAPKAPPSDTMTFMDQLKLWLGAVGSKMGTENRFIPVNEEQKKYQESLTQNILNPEPKGIKPTAATEAQAAQESAVRATVNDMVEQLKVPAWKQTALELIDVGVRLPTSDPNHIGSITDLMTQMKSLPTPVLLTKEDLSYVADALVEAQQSALPGQPAPLSAQQKAAIVKSITRTQHFTTYGLYVSAGGSMWEALRAQKTPQLPPNMTLGDMYDVLKSAGIDTADLDKSLLDVKSAMPSILKSAAETQARYDLLQSQFAQLPMSELAQLIQDGKAQALVSSAGAVLMMPVTWWQHYVTDLLAGAGVANLGPLVSKLPGGAAANVKMFGAFSPVTFMTSSALRNALGVSDKSYADFQQRYQQALTSDMGTADAYRYAFENWHTNGLRKLALSIAADPTSYMGFGWTSDALHSLPLAGRVVGAAHDAAFISAPNSVFHAVQYGLRSAIPKTIEQAARETSVHAVDVINSAVLKTLKASGSYHITLSTIPLAEYKSALLGLAKITLEHPGTDASELAQASTHLWTRPEITTTSLKSITQKMGLGIKITAEQVDFAETLAARTAGLGEGNVHSIFEAGNLLADKLGVKQTDALARVAAVDFYNTLKEQTVKSVDSILIGKTSKEVYMNLVDSITAKVKVVKTAEFVAEHQKLAAIGSWLHEITPPQALIAAHAIDSVSRSFARAQLLFAWYSPANIIENYMKTALASLDPSFSKGSSDRLLNRWGDMIGVPVGMRQEFASSLELGSFKRAVREAQPNFRGISPASIRAMKTDSNWASRLGTYLDDVLVKSSARVGALQQANYLDRAAWAYLWKQEPAALAAAFDLTHNPNIALPLISGGLDPKLAADIQNQLFSTLLHNPENLDKLPTYYTPETLSRQELLVHLGNYSGSFSPTVLNYIFDSVSSGTLTPANYHSILQTSARDAVYESILTAPDVAVAKLKQLVDHMESEPIKSADDLLLRAQVLADASQAFNDLLSTHTQEFRAYASTIHNLDKKRQAYEELWQNVIHPFTATYKDSVERLAKQIKSNLTFSPDSQKLSQLADTHVAYAAKIEAARLEQHSIEKKLFAELDNTIIPAVHARHGNYATDPEVRAWWDKFYAERNTAWSKVSTASLQDQINLDTLALELNLTSPIGDPVNRFGQRLTFADVQNITGTDASVIFKELGSLLPRDSWIQRVKTRANAVAGTVGKTADQLGFTNESLGAVYDDLRTSLKGEQYINDLAAPQLAALDNLTRDFRGLIDRRGSLLPSNSEALISSAVQRVKESLISSDDPALSNLQGTLGTGEMRSTAIASWNSSRQRAFTSALHQYELDFPVYDHPNMLSTALRTVFPFWTYEAHRLPWLLKTFTQHPGTLPTVKRYLDSTDTGYIHIPGTGIELNALRSTIFMGGFRGILGQNYPSHYDRFPGLTGTFNELNRLGFYENVWASGFQTLFGQRSGSRSQLGELMPPIIQTPLEAFVAANPTNSLSRFIYDSLLPSRYRDLLVAEQISSLNGPGSDILNKLNLNRPLTPDDLKWWSRGQQAVAKYNIVAINAGLMRLRPEELIAFQQASAQLIAEQTGISISTQDSMRKAGLSLSDYYPIDPRVSALVNDLEGADRWQGISSAMQPSEQALNLSLQQDFWSQVNSRADAQLSTKLSLTQRLLLAQGQEGKLTPQQWLDQVKSTKSDLRSFISNLQDSGPYKLTTDSSGNLVGVAVTLADRQTQSLQRGEPLKLQHWLKEIQDLYYSHPLGERFDSDTGTTVTDWSGYYSWLQAVTDSIPEPYKSEFLAFIHKNETPMETAHRLDSAYMQPYFSANQLVLQAMPVSDQSIIQEYLGADSPEKRLALKGELNSSNDKIISTYNSALSEFKTNLRLLDPELDARLILWNNMTPASKEGLAAAIALRKSYGFAE